ncbi:MAG: hypothetical protein IPO98_02480 [Saprospiraceae bacterium]|nr:hypothetical protein [Saprospiraceae bacterium]
MLPILQLVAGEQHFLQEAAHSVFCTLKASLTVSAWSGLSNITSIASLPSPGISGFRVKGLLIRHCHLWI